MPLFEVELSDGTTQIMQAHNKRELKEALKHVTLTRITPRQYCRACRKVAATVQRTFCEPCWEKTLAEFRETYKNENLTEQELQDLAMSFYVDA